jgi:hypothetical protein
MMDKPKCFRVQHDLQNMGSFGPTVEIDIEFPTQPSAISRQYNIRALIDTGAGRSVVSQGFIARIGAQPNTQIIATPEDGKSEKVPALRCVLFTQTGLNNRRIVPSGSVRLRHTTSSSGGIC